MILAPDEWTKGGWKGQVPNPPVRWRGGGGAACRTGQWKGLGSGERAGCQNEWELDSKVRNREEVGGFRVWG